MRILANKCHSKPQTLNPETVKPLRIPGHKLEPSKQPFKKKANHENLIEVLGLVGMFRV